MKITVTIRNLFGGFLGGFLGVLAAGLIHPLMTPIGCIVGVLTGYWHDEVFAYCKDSVCRAASRIQLCDVSGLMGRVRQQSRSVWCVLQSKVPDISQKEIDMTLKAIVFVVISPIKFFFWAMSHPVYVARSITALIYVSLSVCFLIGVYWAFPNASADIGSLFFFLMPVLICGGLGIALRLTTGFEEGSVKIFYETWSRYSQHNPVSFALNEVKVGIILMAAMILYMAVAIAALAALLGGGLVVFIGILIAIGFIRGLWKASSRREHLLCLCVSIAVTITSVVLFQNSLSGIALWMVALASGFASGVLSELARRMVLWSFDHTPIWNCIADDDVGEVAFGIVGSIGKKMIEPAGVFFENYASRFAQKIVRL